MAEQTKQALKVENNTNFPNNNTGYITPALLREFNTDMIDSTVNQTTYNVDSASWNEQINALDPSGSAASIVSLNEFTASIQGTNAFTASATISINALNAFSASVVPTSTGSLLTTASFSGNTMTFTKGDGSTFGVVIPDVSGSTTTALNQATASLQAFTASVAGTNAFTASIAGTNTFTASAKLQLTALESTSASVNTSVSSLNTFTASIAGTNAFTASIAGTNPWTASTNARLNSIEATTASLQSQINLLSGSGTVIAVDALNAFTASIFGTNAFTASIKETNTFTASLAGTNAFTQSAQNSLNSLNAATSSYITSAVTASMSVATASFAATASLARNVVVVGTNANQSTLGAGTVVRIVGANGDNPTFNTASYTDEAQSSNTLGILNSSVAPTATAEITTLGVVTGIDTSTYAAGDLLYLGANGTFTNVQPQAPLNIVVLGEVLRVQLNNGSMFVNISNGWELNELHNVRITNPQQGDMIVYEATSSLWKNVPSSSVTPTDISALNAFTASIAGTNTFTASIAGTNAFTASAQQSINALNSISGGLVTSMSADTLLPNTFTVFEQDGTSYGVTLTISASAPPQSDITALNNFTASVAGTNAFTASIAGTNAFTASALTTASANLNTITFTKGNGTTFAVTVNTGSAGAAFPFTGSALITGSLGVLGPVAVTGSIISKGTGTFTSEVTLNSPSFAIDLNGNQSSDTGMIFRGFPLGTATYQLRFVDNNRTRILIAPTSGSGTSDLQQQFLIQQNGPGRTGVYNRTFTKVGYANENFGYPNNIIISSSVGSNTDQRNFIGFGNISNPTDAPAGGWNFVFASANEALGGAKTRIDGHLYVSQSFTGALQSGYAWVGDANGYSRAVATSSFAGTPVDISALNAFTASVAGTNTFTASAQLEINALEGFTASVAGTNGFTQSAQVSIDALNAATSSYAKTNTSNTFTANQIISGNLDITGTLTAATASFVSVTSSVILGGSRILLNTFTPSVRYGGLEVADSGSTNLTGSLLWDSQNDVWVYVNPSGSSYASARLISGPKSATLGSEPTLTQNRVPKADDGDHIVDSQISDDGTTVTITNAISASTFVGLGNLTSYSTSVDSRINAITVPSLTALNEFTASIFNTNAFTQSAQLEINALEAFTASAQLEINALEAFTASIAGTNAFTASATLRLNSLESTSASVNTSLASLNGFTASVAGTNAFTTSTTSRLNSLEAKTGSLASTGSNTFVGTQIFSGSVQGRVIAATITSNTASLDFSQGNFFTLALAATVGTHISASNVQPGETVSVRITQNATPGTLTYSPAMKFPSGSAYTASTIANAVDIITFISYDNSTVYASSVKNMI